MTVAYDSNAESAVAANPQAVNLVPAGTLRGVVAFLSQTGHATDIVTSVSAGGVGMTRVRSDADTTGVPGRVYAYQLGTGIPTDTLSLSVARTEATTVLHLVVIGLTAAADTEVVDSDGLSVNQADPQVTLQYATRTCLSLCGLYSSANDVTEPVDLATMTRIRSHDFGTEVSVVSRQTTAGSADFTIGYVAPSVNLALTALAISEVEDTDPVPIVTGSGSASALRSPAWIRTALQQVRDVAALVKLLAIELPRLAQSVVTYERVARLTYGATVRPSGQLSRVSLVSVTTTAVWTMANPTEPREGVELTFDIYNGSGGTMGAVTWSSEYELGSAFVNPAVGKHRLIGFIRMPDKVWREFRRSANDVD